MRSIIRSTVVGCVAASVAIAAVAFVAEAKTKPKHHSSSSRGPRGYTGAAGATGPTGAAGLGGSPGLNGQPGPAGAGAIPFQSTLSVPGEDNDDVDSSNFGTLFPIQARCESDASQNYSAELVVDLPAAADMTTTNMPAGPAYSANWVEESNPGEAQSDQGSSAGIEYGIWYQTFSGSGYQHLVRTPSTNSNGLYDLSGQILIAGGDGQNESVDFTMEVKGFGSGAGAACYFWGNIVGSSANA